MCEVDQALIGEGMPFGDHLRRSAVDHRARQNSRVVVSDHVDPHRAPVRRVAAHVREEQIAVGMAALDVVESERLGGDAPVLLATCDPA